MDAGVLTAHGADRGGAFYLSALTYGQHLWQRGRAARALLSVDRALGADLGGHEPELLAWPLPYAAVVWFVRHTPRGVFIGNPRVHYQHLAGRMNEPRREQRRWRAWAAWALVRQARPEWPADPKHAVREPSLIEIASKLDEHGLSGERIRWEESGRSIPA